MEDSEAQRAVFQSLLEGVNRDLTLISCNPRSFPGHASCVPPPSRGRRGETTNLGSVLSDCDTFSLEEEEEGGGGKHLLTLQNWGSTSGTGMWPPARILHSPILSLSFSPVHPPKYSPRFLIPL